MASDDRLLKLNDVVDTGVSFEVGLDVVEQNNRSVGDSTSVGSKCSHYGGSKHTKETRFKIHGYPNWWANFQERKKHDGTCGGKGNSGGSFGQSCNDMVKPVNHISVNKECTINTALPYTFPVSCISKNGS